MHNPPQVGAIRLETSKYGMVIILLFIPMQKVMEILCPEAKDYRDIYPSVAWLHVHRNEKLSY